MMSRLFFFQTHEMLALENSLLPEAQYSRNTTFVATQRDAALVSAHANPITVSHFT